MTECEHVWDGPTLQVPTEVHAVVRAVLPTCSKCSAVYEIVNNKLVIR